MTRVALSALAVSAVLVTSSSGQSQVAPGPSTAEAASYTPAAPLPSSAERMRLRSGLAAAESGDWSGLAQLRDSATDPLVRRMLQWRWAASSEAPLYFDDIAQALNELQGWPGRTAMRTRAEQAILSSRLSASERIAFLRSEGGPITGDGRMALAMSLRDAGQRSEAVEIARASWRDDALSTEMEDRALAAFSSSFSSEDHAARVDGLLWRNQHTAARRLLSRVSTADRLLANARIAIQSRARRGLQAAVDAVPGSRADNPGFLYDRAQYRRRAGNPEDALPLMVEVDPRQAPAAARSELFAERRLYVPRALRSRNYRQAYALVTNHGLTSGEAFADAEWMAGWLSLRFLGNPQRAREHFAHLSENVSSPVSLSRALYWRAEAERALGNTAESERLLEQAAQYNFTYYGQLAATRGDRTATLSLPETARVTDAARSRFESRELVRALRLMAEVGAQRDFESIAFYLDDTLDDPMELELLSEMAREQSYYRTALRSAKAGLFRNVVATSAAYPTLELPAAVQQRGRPEPALVHAIIRQESEFDPGAISSANARGLMQLIPSTAQIEARRAGMSFQRAALTTDPQYNMTLGSQHLAGLIDDFGGSYVMAIAAYNAGSSNVRNWVNEWGDPRSSNVDVIDWIELIPFSETRNYVQRVTENLQVYRHRLAGEPVAIQLERDLHRGR
ncbi:lytic transglycosylase domain-containing protein [Vitreimonas sp.]|uniref:lytic transglycosylase domain-containing protein n=1 Tax=Vitreimonas sp. TaxID=3069702 RepID=UPI002D789DF1|nr:lytic transglycosylase domain-containing protein [Vitreimonas sp.]